MAIDGGSGDREGGGAMDWTDRLLLTWTRDGPPPMSPDERLALERDGTVWLWIRVPADAARADLVGTFRVAAAIEDIGRADQLAAALADDGAGEEAVEGEGARAAHAPSVVVAGPGFSRRYVAGTATGLGADALRLGDELTAAALTAPLAALRLTVAATAPPAVDLEALGPERLAAVPEADRAVLDELLERHRGAGGITLRLGLEALGEQPVAMKLAPETLQAHWLAGDGGTVAWVELDPPDHGLAGGERPLGGLDRPAEIPPGVTATTALRVARPTEPADAVELRAGGTIEIVGPWEGLGVPADRWQARSAPAPLPAPEA